MKAQTGPLANIPLWLIEHREVSAMAVRLWGLLYAKYTTRTPDAPVAEPTRPQLAHDLDCSVDSIDRYLKALSKARAITVINQHTSSKQQAQNRYELTMVQGGRNDTAGLAAPVRPHKTANLFSERPLTIAEQSERAKESSSSRSLVRTVQYVRFDQFWNLYPRNHKKQRAQVAWLKLKVEQDTALWTAIIGGLRRWMDYWSSQGTKQQYIPYASTWLNERSWEDGVERETRPALSRQSQSLVAASRAFLDRRKGDAS
jgi:hypothetical protein